MDFFKRKLTYVLFFSTAILAGVSASILIKKVAGDGVNISCLSDLKLYAGNNEINLTITYDLQNGSGVATISGFSLNGEGKKTSRISIRKSFNYVMYDGFFELHSIVNDNVQSNTMVEFPTKYVPLFYTSDSVSKHIIRIKEVKTGAWVFMGASVPYFVCSKN